MYLYLSERSWNYRVTNSFVWDIQFLEGRLYLARSLTFRVFTMYYSGKNQKK